MAVCIWFLKRYRRREERIVAIGVNLNLLNGFQLANKCKYTDRDVWINIGQAISVLFRVWSTEKQFADEFL